MQYEHNGDLMPQEIYESAVTFASCSPLYPPSQPPHTLPCVCGCALATLQCVSEKIALSTSFKGTDPQHVTSSPSKANMQLLPKVGSVLQQVLEIACFGGMLFSQGILTLTLFLSAIMGFYRAVLLLLYRPEK